MRSMAVIAGLLTIATTMSGCSLGYLLKQGYGQVSLLTQRRPIRDVMSDSRLSEAQRLQLEWVLKAKDYAESRIGLKKTESYTQVIMLDRDAVSYVVAGAPKDALKPYLWHFPLVGAVPYKGFFDREDAEAEKRWLEEQGYDTYLRGVGAFSLLGWVPDPLYSPVLSYSKSGLANLIIHELTHATLFLAGKPSFNEGFATFVGNVGAEEFLRQTLGPDAPEIRAAAEAAVDQELYERFLGALTESLEGIYGAQASAEEKLQRREQRLAKASVDYQALPFKTAAYRRTDLKFNNAFLVTHQTYRGNQDRFAKAYDRVGRDLPAFVRFFQETVSKQQDPEAWLDEWLAASD